MSERENFSKEQFIEEAGASNELLELQNEDDKKNEEIEEAKETEIKKPKQRYFFHGSLRQNWEKIEMDSVMNFTEPDPNLTSSPGYAHDFIKKELTDRPGQISKRTKYLNKPLTSEEISEKDRVLLVIEPCSAGYKAFNNRIGAPNSFSSPEQVPTDANNKLYFRNIWKSDQKYIREKRLTKNPGLMLDKKRTNQGEWINVSKDERLKKKKELPSHCIKMVIINNPKFDSIFKELRNEFKKNNSISTKEYTKKLLGYFAENKDTLLKDKITEKFELANNMIIGEIEYLLVSKVRSLFLEIGRLKGKTLVEVNRDEVKKEKIESRPHPSQQAIIGDIEELEKLDIDDAFLKRYTTTTAKKLRRELCDGIV